MCYIITLEGNIGSGKSSILNKINTNDRVKVLQEPIDEWNQIKAGNQRFPYDPSFSVSSFPKRTEDGKSILELFYDDPKQYAFEFQVLVYMSLYNAIKTQSRFCDILICERSLESNIHIFGEMLYDMGFISPTQRGILKYMYETFNIQTNKRVYLFVPYSICFCRIKIRNRPGEEKITGDYLKSLQKYHRNFFERFPYDVIIQNDKEIDNFIGSL
jgi:deoxynucleoside kinase